MKVASIFLLGFLCAFGSFAQTGSSYLMMNFNLRSGNPYYANSYYSNPFFQTNRFSNSETFPIGLQWIKYHNDHSAMRFGFTLFTKTLQSKFAHSTIEDTSIYRSSSYPALIPKFTFGKEWQKHIHKDVVLYGGADIGFGAMKNPKMAVTQKYAMGSFFSYSANQSASVWMLNLSARPFLGMRINWNRFVVGYEASLPVNYTQAVGEDVRNVGHLKLQHQLNFGYKLKKRK